MPKQSLGEVNAYSKRESTICTGEVEVCSLFFRLLLYVSECIGGDVFDATGAKVEIVGLPDLVVWQSPTTTLALVIECKTPWALDVGVEMLLDDIYNSHREYHATWLTPPDKSMESPMEWTMPRKVFHAIRQLYGYMSFNKRRFGILTTFTTTYLFKRDGEGKLFISKGIAANQLVPLTLLEAITRLLLNGNPHAEEDLSEAEPTPPKDPFAQEMPKQSKAPWTKTENMSKKPKPKKRKAPDSQAPSDQDERELVLITDLPDYHVIAGGGSVSIVASELDEIPVAIKTVDTCKRPELLDELYHECDAYTALEAVQGDC
ncbi:hypothetical protein DYB32_010401, partial [Aphanomyces invadans]